MSKSSLHSVKGKAKWARVFEHNRDNADFFADTEGMYKIDVYLEQEELNKVSQAKSRLKPKLDEDGVFVSFRRPNKPKNGIEALGGVPSVVDAEGNSWDEEVNIGNGSEVEVYFEVYASKFGTGTRLKGIKVLNLVEYEGAEGGGGGGNKLPWE